MTPDKGHQDAEGISPAGFTDWMTALGGKLEDARALLDKLAANPAAAREQDLTSIADVLDQSRKALSGFDEHLAAVFRRNPFPMWVFDPKTLAFLTVNEAAVRHYGYSREEFLSMTLRDIRPREDIERLEKSIAPPGEDVYPKDLGPPVRHLKKDGTPICVEITAKSIEYAGREARLVLSLDITERVEAERQLRQSEERFRIAANSTNDAVWDWDVPRNHLWWGKGLADLFGYEEGSFEPTIEWWAGQIHPEDRDRAFGSLLAATEGTAEFWSEEYRFRKVDGGYAYVRDSGHIIRDENGKALRAVGGVADMTRQRTMMEVLRRNEMAAYAAQQHAQRTATRLRTILDSITDAYITLSPACIVTAINRRAEQLLRIKREESLGKPLAEVLPSIEGTQTEAALRRALEKGEAQRIEDYYAPASAWLEVNLYPSAEGVSAFLRDITARKEAEEKLRKSEQRFRSIFESNVVGLLFADLDGAILDANDALLDMIGYTREELRQAKLNWRELTPPKYRAADEKALAALRETGRCEPFEKVLYRKDGGQVPVLIGSSLLGDGDNIAVGFMLDIGERVQAREALIRLNEELDQRVRERTAELEKARDQAQRANQAKNEFLSRMSHELRTPMNAVLGFAQILEMQELGKDQRHCVKQMLAGGRHLLTLIDEVLDIARIESGRITLSPEPIVLRDVLRQSLEMVRPAIEKQEIELDWDTGGCEGTWVVADPARLKQVFINLLSNAIKYNRRGGLVRLYCEHVGESILRVHFIDTGMGISPDKLERLFTPFDRLGQEGSPIEGSGLGLAVSKRLLDVMKGRIHISSSPGEGTTVTVDLRRIEAPTKEELQRKSEPAVRISSMEIEDCRKVLYIEDNLSNVALVEHLLSFSPSIELLSAASGGAGLDIALDQRPDLILLDLHLPDMEGYGVLQRIRANPQTADTPVAVISADATPGQVERLLAAGANAYLTKPLDVREFLSKVYELLQETGESPDDSG